MAERQETSVMVSIQEILRDAQSREEQEKVEAEQRARQDEQRRVDEQRKRQDEEEARLRAEEDERQRRAFEEQRRQAEISAMQEAAVQRARSEAEAQARLAEMAARQEHERHLHVLSQDKHKKRLTMLVVGLGLFFVVGGVGAGILLKRSSDEASVLKAQTAQLQAQIDESAQKQARLASELQNTKDPEKIAELTAQIDAEKQRNLLLQQQAANPTKKPAAYGGGGGGGGGSGGAATPKPSKPCNCTPGDPMCSCL
jgi:colicin import membrane protein